MKGIVRAFKSMQCMGGIPHLKHTVGCQMSTLILGYAPLISHVKYPTAKFLSTRGLNQQLSFLSSEEYAHGFVVESLSRSGTWRELNRWRNYI